MNSLNKHVPKIVGAMGVFFLCYSMFTFFRAPVYRPPAVTPHTPTRTTPAAPVAKAIPYRGKTWEAQTYGKPGQVTAMTPAQEKVNAQAMIDRRLAPARSYLLVNGLKMFLPEDRMYSETTSDGMKILVGLKGDKPEFYVISGKQKISAEQARAEMEDQFAEVYGLQKVKQSAVNNRNLGSTAQFNGQTKTGEDFQAMFFYNPSTNNSHMVFMVDKDLSRQPARTRQIFDSIEYDR